MTSKDAQTQLQKTEQARTAARAEQVAAQAALEAANRALAEAAEKGIPADSDKATKVREHLRDLENTAFQAKGRVARCGFALRRAEQALAESKARADRLTVHAAVLDKLDKALAAIASKDQAILALGREFQDRLAEDVTELRKAITDADALWSTLTPDVRARDVNPPHQSAMYFGQSSPLDPGLLYRLGVLTSHLAVTAPTAPAHAGPTPLRAAEGGPR